MTQYKCSNLNCGEVFTHTAKLTENDLSIGMNTLGIKKSLETHVCPFCHNIKFTEYVEPIEEIEDVISVEYVGVGAKIAEGYRVKEIYAKSVTLIKPKVKVEP
jgi:hypothetical protein